jgi:O-antigen ligase
MILLVILMPFHAFLTTWIASYAGHLLAMRAWKEVALTALCFIGVYFILKDKMLRTTLLGKPVNKLIVAYGLWLLFIVIISAKFSISVAQGLAIDLRFLAVFILFQIILFYKPISKTEFYKIIILPSAVVAAFGLMQVLFLSKNFLSHFGYNKKTTIPPYFTIDEQQSKLRYASTLSGPNTLGAYLVLPLSLFASAIKVIKTRAKLIFGAIYLLAIVTVLYASHSRSAWIAAVVASAAFLIMSLSKKGKIILMCLVIAIIPALSFYAYQNRSNQFVADVLLHDNPTQGGEISSNLGHLDALKNGLGNVAKRPLLGCGVGCAGPASVRNSGGPKISENYYVQVAEETGIIGLGLFLAIIILLGKELYKKRSNLVVKAVFCSLIGLSATNLLLHTWADDTLSIVWWAAAATTLYSNFAATKLNNVS